MISFNENIGSTEDYLNARAVFVNENISITSVMGSFNINKSLSENIYVLDYGPLKELKDLDPFINETINLTEVINFSFEKNINESISGSEGFNGLVSEEFTLQDNIALTEKINFDFAKNLEEHISYSEKITIPNIVINTPGGYGFFLRFIR